MGVNAGEIVKCAGQGPLGPELGVCGSANGCPQTEVINIFVFVVKEGAYFLGSPYVSRENGIELNPYKGTMKLPECRISKNK